MTLMSLPERLVMNTELEQLLMERFPWFEARNVWTGEKLGIAYPCECGNGWGQLIYNCMEEIELLYQNKNADISELHIYQIKEKYARLMIYLGNYIDGVMDILSKYEDLSANTCEVCGASGEVCMKNFWIKSLCKKHRDEFGFSCLESKM